MRQILLIISGLLALALLGGLSGCADDPVEPELPPPPPSLVGTWNWVNTSGPNTWLTPQNQGYTLTLIFDEDSTYVEYKDAAIITQGTFVVGDSTYWLQEWMQILTLEGHLFQKAFTFHTRDSLILSDYVQSNALVRRYILAD